MHTQTESKSRRDAAGTAPRLHAAAGLGLYLLTLFVEVLLGASVRWLLFFLGAATVGAIVPLGLSAESLAWVAALTPIAWSLLGLVLPGHGQLWGRRLGARRPTRDETAALLDALELLRGVNPNLSGRVGYLVLDDPLPAAAVRGRTVTVTRALLESDSLAAVLAHELGHAHSLDGRLTEALDRLALWDDPLASAPPERGGEAQVVAADADTAGGVLWAAARWTLRLAGGGVAEQLLAPLWAARWRAREYAADVFAASLGQAEDLAQHLTDQEQPFDAPQPRLLVNAAQHPPVALRTERLRAISLPAVSE